MRHLANQKAYMYHTISSGPNHDLDQTLLDPRAMLQPQKHRPLNTESHEHGLFRPVCHAIAPFASNHRKSAPSRLQQRDLSGASSRWRYKGSASPNSASRMTRVCLIANLLGLGCFLFLRQEVGSGFLSVIDLGERLYLIRRDRVTISPAGYSLSLNRHGVQRSSRLVFAWSWAS